MSLSCPGSIVRVKLPLSVQSLLPFKYATTFSNGLTRFFQSLTRSIGCAAGSLEGQIYRNFLSIH
jgi:hypothetical protein